MVEANLLTVDQGYLLNLAGQSFVFWRSFSVHEFIYIIRSDLIYATSPLGGVASN